MVDQVVFASSKKEWETPRWLYNLLDKEFHFTLDPCATDDNTMCAEYFTKEENGLTQPWAPDTVYLNPPYGRMAAAWIAKAYRESQRGATVVVLLPNRSSNIWWRDYVMRAYEIRFIDGRLNFAGGKYSAPFPSVIVVFKPGDHWPVIGKSISARGQ